MAYTKYSLTPANNNAAPPDGAPEGMLPSAVNDTMRDMMAQIRDVGDGIRGGTYTMTAPVITGGSITGVALSGNTLTNPVITGGSINNTPIGASTANTGAFTTLGATGVATFSAGTVSAPAITTTGDTNTGIFFPAADTIAFTEGGVESMRIDSAGFVGIGTSSPAAKLSLTSTGSTTADGIRLTFGSEARSHNIYSNISTGRDLLIAPYRAITLQAGAGTTEGEVRLQSYESTIISTGSSYTERMRIPAAGGVQAVTCVSVGNATPAASGAGITFPATQSASSDANTLDDYEEGTWTPVVKGTTTAGTASYSVQQARYTKTGRVVFVEFYMQWSSGNGTGNLFIDGLPFTSAGSSTFPALSIGYWDSVAITIGQVPMAYVNASNTRIDFSCMNAGGGSPSVLPYDGAGALQIAGCYTV